jgi:hypothetical protein
MFITRKKKGAKTVQNSTTRPNSPKIAIKPGKIHRFCTVAVQNGTAVQEGNAING